MLESDIDLDIFRLNLLNIKKRIGNVKLCLVVKSDAYGHGLKEIALAASSFVDELAVATLEEASILINSKIKLPINVLECSKQQIDSTMRDIIPTICSISDIEHIKNSVNQVNVKFNSGMNRLGANERDFFEIVKTLKKSNIKIRSFFTHFYDGTDVEECKKQLALFKRVISPFSSPDIILHAGASSALSLGNEFFLDMIRVGIATYGYNSFLTSPIMKVHTDILQVFNVKKGMHIGYGCYLAPRNMRIAIIRIGYGDGFRRKQDFNNEDIFVSINGSLCPVVGQICMDMCAVDVSKIKLTGNERAYILGEGASALGLSQAYGTIIYEVLNGFKAARLKRNYINR